MKNAVLFFAALLTIGLIGWMTLSKRQNNANADMDQNLSTLAAPVFDEAFGEHWYDQKAELAGYDLTYTRYGQARKGSAVTIFVTEPFSKSKRVKPDGFDAQDRFGVMKLNLVQDYPTGLYDYNMMTSVFVSTEQAIGRPAGSTSKVSFSAQEWCGHVYDYVIFNPMKVRQMWHSYFESEADGAQELEYPVDGIAEDALFHWARQMATPVLAPGASVDVKVLRSLETARLRHVSVAWDTATLTRSETTQTIRVPAGEFEVEVFEAKISAEGNLSRTWAFYVEKEFPHRIIRWTRSDGVDAKLLSSSRLAYWQLNANGKEQLLKELGLTPREARMP